MHCKNLNPSNVRLFHAWFQACDYHDIYWFEKKCASSEVEDWRLKLLFFNGWQVTRFHRTLTLEILSINTNHNILRRKRMMWDLINQPSYGWYWCQTSLNMIHALMMEHKNFHLSFSYTIAHPEDYINMVVKWIVVHFGFSFSFFSFWVVCSRWQTLLHFLLHSKKKKNRKCECSEHSRFGRWS